MAKLAVIMTMITVTSTATSILGIIKQRCGESGAIVELASKMAELVNKVCILQKTLEGGSHVPQDKRGISTARNLRREEFVAILKNLDKMSRRSKRTHPLDHTEKFIVGQGWTKKMEGILNDLVQLRNGIENIVSNLDAAEFVVTKFEEIVTVDVTNKNKRGRREQHTQTEMVGNGTVNYIDQYLVTMVKLTDANKVALNRYGNLGELAVPKPLFEADFEVIHREKNMQFSVNPTSRRTTSCIRELCDGLFLSIRLSSCERSRFCLNTLSYPEFARERQFNDGNNEVLRPRE